MTLLRPQGTGEIRVLAIDGGGVRGLLPATIAARIEKTLGRPIDQMFDVLAGTSTGALVAAALARPGRAIDAESVRRMFHDEPLTIFPEQRRLRRALHRATREHDFDTALSTYLDQRRLADCTVEVFLPAYDLTTSSAVYFTRAEAIAHGPDTLLAQAVLASSAAPTYLPPEPLRWAGRDRLFIDGGVFANDPALAVVLALRANYPRRRIRVLSLGCGTQEIRTDTDPARLRRTREFLLGDLEEPTLLGAAAMAVGVFMDASSAMSSQLLPELADDYMRIQPEFSYGQRPGLDHATSDTIETMAAVAQQCWSKHKKQVVEFLSA